MSNRGTVQQGWHVVILTGWASGDLDLAVTGFLRKSNELYRVAPECGVRLNLTTHVSGAS